jgi:hypothetical protein
MYKTRYQMAIEDFKKARQQAALEVVFGRLRGQSTGLLSYEEVARKLRVTGRSNIGTPPFRSRPLWAASAVIPILRARFCPGCKVMSSAGQR